ncbi:G2 M phase-specific E3 ubiquitin- ligase [Paramuricea clavata]|nr:G2 M phase-specific E3 ubiquitin- ligase [Paramuricea clavata]
MADSNVNSSQISDSSQLEENEESRNSLRAIQLLQEATRLLSPQPNSLSSTTVNQVSETSNSPAPWPLSNSSPAPSNSSPAPGARHGDIVGNLRSLFSPYGTERFRSQSSAYQIAPKRTRRNGSSNSNYYKVKETWTHEFFCLAKCNQNRVPQRSEKNMLQQCGLGRKKICFNSNSNPAKLNEMLLSHFPKLANGGGFEILRSGGAKATDLVIIHPPPIGYSVPFLRDLSGLGQALAYVRPLQRNLDLTIQAIQPSMIDKSAVNATEKAQIIECLSCGKEVPIIEWHDHHCALPACDEKSPVPLGACTTVTPGVAPTGASKNMLVGTKQPSTDNNKDPNTYVIVINDDDVTKLSTIFPKVSQTMIGSVLKTFKGNAEMAASQLADLSDETYGESVEEYLFKNIKEGQEQSIVISRKSTCILADLIKLHKRGLDIQLIPDVEFIGEPGVDASGLTREFFHLSMTALATGDRRITLFEGERNHLLPLHSTDALESNLYFYVGRMIAHTFLHKGYPFVAQAVVQYICSQSIEESIPLISIKDVPDLTIRQDIEKVADLNNSQKQAIDWFKDFISQLPAETDVDDKYKPTLEKLTQFAYADPLPPTRMLTVKFRRDDKELPDADACAATIQLPTCHATFEAFKKAFDCTLSAQATGFGRM